LHIQRSDADNDKKVTSNKADREVMLTMTKRSPVITVREVILTITKVTRYKGDGEVMLKMRKRSPVIAQSEK